MMIKVRKYKLTVPLLTSYHKTAIENAKELLEESKFLLSKGYNARAYFIATIAIEESGKAYLAFDAMGRNLNDGAVCNKL